jgi:homoserine O-acetyltransferase/O-succinyltransferase
MSIYNQLPSNKNNMNLFEYQKPFELESGRKLPGFELAYQTFGELNESKDNVIWITHALTGNSNPTEWWSGLVGEGKLYDPGKWFIVCANVLGSCYGSSGPLSINPDTGSRYYHYFPSVTVRDIVASLDLLRAHLGIEKIHTLIGGSLGAQQVLEWAVQQPDRFENIIPIAGNAKHSPWGIAFNETQRMAIQADPTWHGQFPDAGKKGLRAARAIALLSYRNLETYNLTQLDKEEKTNHYKASSYQNYQGDKFTARFNAYSYWTLTKVMDSHDLGRNRGGVENALKKIRAKALYVGISSDILFPSDHIKEIATLTPNANFIEISSLYGHDGFLLEFEQLTTIIQSFYKQKNILHYEEVK